MQYFVILLAIGALAKGRVDGGAQLFRVHRGERSVDIKRTRDCSFSAGGQGQGRVELLLEQLELGGVFRGVGEWKRRCPGILY